MIVGNQNPPTDIEVIVKRINPKNKKLEIKKCRITHCAFAHKKRVIYQ